MSGNLGGQFFIDFTSSLTCLVEAGLSSTNLLADEINGETLGVGGVLRHSSSFLMLLASCVFHRPPPLFIVS